MGSLSDLVSVFVGLLRKERTVTVAIRTLYPERVRRYVLRRYPDAVVAEWEE